MNLIDRFTRDRVSKVVWSLSFIGLVGVFAASIVMADRARDAELDRAGQRAARQIDQVLAPSLTEISLAAELEGDQLETAQTAADRIASDPRVTAVRLWSLEEKKPLVFSSSESDRARELVGSAEVENDAEIGRAATGGGAPLNVSGGGLGGEDALHTYVLLGDGVAEVAQSRAVVLAPLDDLWGAVRLSVGAAAALVLLLTLLSFRPAVTTINAGVRFSAENAPPGKALIDRDRLDAVDEVYALAQQRVDKLKERLQLAELEKQHLQGELQRSLSGFVPTATSAQVETRAAAPKAEPRSRKRARPVEPVVAESITVPEAAPAEPSAEAAEILAAAAEVGEVVEAASRPMMIEAQEIDAEGLADAETAATEPIDVVEPSPPEVVELPEPEVVELPESEVVAATPSEREAAAIGAWSYSTGTEPAALRDEFDEPGSARDVLDRLMAAETHTIGGPDADPGRIREQIARVAAKKKPGGGEAKNLFHEPEGPKPPWMRDRNG